MEYLLSLCYNFVREKYELDIIIWGGAYDIATKELWLESWEKNKKNNIEVGFDSHELLKGYIPITEYQSLEEFPDIDFFNELKKLKPRYYDLQEIIYGEVICYIRDEKYRVAYYYDKGCYMIMDAADSVIKRLKI